MKKIQLCIKYECIKFFHAQKGWLVAGICLVLHFFVCYFARPDMYQFLFNTDLYYDYVQKYGGEYDANTMDKIAAELKEQTEVENAIWQGEDIYSEEAVLFWNRKNIAREKTGVLNELRKKYTLLEQTREYQTGLVYDLEFVSYSKKFQMDWLALVFGAVLSIGIFAGDFKCGMEQILLPSSMGKRRIYAGKTIAVAFLSGITAAFFYLVQVAVVGKRWRLGDLHMTIQSYSGFEQCTLRVRMWEALVLVGVLKILATMVLALLLANLTKAFQNEILAVGMTVALTGCGFLVKTNRMEKIFFFLTPLRGISALQIITGKMLLLEIIILLLEFILLFFVAIFIDANKNLQ